MSTSSLDINAAEKKWRQAVKKGDKAILANIRPGLPSREVEVTGVTKTLIKCALGQVVIKYRIEDGEQSPRARGRDRSDRSRIYEPDGAEMTRRTQDRQVKRQRDEADRLRRQRMDAIDAAAHRADEGTLAKVERLLGIGGEDGD
jgi:hypothetical protein